MKYRQALVFSYQRFENALISIISIGPLTRITPILNFPIFSQKRDLVGTIKHCFKKSLPKGTCSGKIHFFSSAGFSIITYNGSERVAGLE